MVCLILVVGREKMGRGDKEHSTIGKSFFWWEDMKTAAEDKVDKVDEMRWRGGTCKKKLGGGYVLFHSSFMQPIK